MKLPSEMPVPHNPFVGHGPFETKSPKPVNFYPDPVSKWYGNGMATIQNELNAQKLTTESGINLDLNAASIKYFLSWTSPGGSMIQPNPEPEKSAAVTIAEPGNQSLVNPAPGGSESYPDYGINYEISAPGNTNGFSKGVITLPASQAVVIKFFYHIEQINGLAYYSFQTSTFSVGEFGETEYIDGPVTASGDVPAVRGTQGQN